MYTGHQTLRGPKTGTAARALLAGITMCLLLFTAACDSGSTSSSDTGTGTGVPAPQQYGGAYSKGTATGDTQEGAKFAQWVLDQDPSAQYITDAVVRNNSTLGVKVQPSVTKADIQKLLVALTQGMARTFPDKSLTVNAFYQSGDKLAEALYDTSTNQVNVQFTR